MNEHERLLKEGPRVAPEPEPADPSVIAGPTRRPVRGKTHGRPSVPLPRLARLVPLAVFALVVLGSRSGLGPYTPWVIVALVAGAVVVRRRGRRGQ